MKKGGGNKKGGAFEREILKKMSLWVSCGDRKDIFRRSMMSGGRATLSGMKEFQDQAGDSSLACDHKLGKKFLKFFLTEYKHLKRLKVDSLIYGVPKNKSLLAFWNRLEKDCKKIGRSPFLVARQNFKKDLLLTENYICQFFYHYRICEFRDMNLSICFFDDFIENVDPLALFSCLG